MSTIPTFKVNLIESTFVRLWSFVHLSLIGFFIIEDTQLSNYNDVMDEIVTAL